MGAAHSVRTFFDWGDSSISLFVGKGVLSSEGTSKVSVRRSSASGMTLNSE